ncbi:MAG: CehA/McbA family metallohydrolase [Anaerolineaceae bacterium]|nr:CehA/McbA family metallohydrolase [Anaerolineaceae bacterium]
MSPDWSLSKIYNPRPGWYRGELHVHTSHSDGAHSPADLAEWAKADGLDFLAITDHNRVDAFGKPYPSSDFLLIPGMEVTLQNGHFNVYGLQGKYDWLENICIGLFTVKLAGKYQTTTDLMRRTAGQGLLNSINHPLRVPFDWRDDETELQNVHCLEIWNKPDAPDTIRSNPQAITLWTEWLKAGYRTTAIGGSDHHSLKPLPGEHKSTERLGWPRNHIYAENLSGAAILSAMRQHRVYVSMGPEVTFQAKFGDEIYNIGADLGQVAGEIRFLADIFDCPVPGYAQIVKNGSIVREVPVKSRQASLEFNDVLHPAEPAWYRLDVYDQTGLMLAITNPIFTGPPRQPLLKRFGDFIDRV